MAQSELSHTMSNKVRHKIKTYPCLGVDKEDNHESCLKEASHAVDNLQGSVLLQIPVGKPQDVAETQVFIIRCHN